MVKSKKSSKTTKDSKVAKATKLLDSRFRKATHQKGMTSDEQHVAATSFCAGMTAIAEANDLKLTKAQWREVFSSLVQVLSKYSF